MLRLTVIPRIDESHIFWELPLQLIQRLLTHQSPQMTQRYAHLAEESLRRGAQVMDKIIAEILGGQREAKETL